MDKLIKEFAFDGQVRLIGILSTEIVSRALEIHQLSPVATAALGRFLTAGAMMGSMMKNEEDRLTLMMKGDGPLGNMVVCANSKGIVKGYAENPAVDLPLNSVGKLDVGGAVGKNGFMTVIKDIGLKEPVSGSVEIVSGEVGDEIATYFVTSEQIPTAVAVGVLVQKDGTVGAAGGYLIQIMPGTDSAIIDMIEDRIRHMNSLSTLLKDGFSIEEILRAVSGDDNVVVLEELHPEFLCDCSRERMGRALMSIPEEEREKMKQEDGFIEIKCSFCHKTERW
ncbi:MAG: Hsp33 family molecular chaperone HslO [Clostridia bacterium]|nr:Hsp33 family molecular chaperone HslO [Clostridia bacterium]